MDKLVKYVSVAEMIEIEKAADKSGLTYERMMENAGKSLAEAIFNAYSHLPNNFTTGLIGKGNNGGDTLIALCHLINQGWQTAAYVIEEKTNNPLLNKLAKKGGEIFSHTQDKKKQQLPDLIQKSGIILDGILGTGIRLPLRDPVPEILKELDKILYKLDSPPIVVAVDCPSGIDCDTGEVAQECIPADLTVCMAAVKQGLLAFPAYDYLGNLKIGDIGKLDHLDAWSRVKRFVINREFIYSTIPIRKSNSHKGTFGTALIVAGSDKYSGAALLAGKAAFRSGVGWVSIAVPSFLHPSFAGQFPEATWLPLPSKKGGISTDAAEELVSSLGKETAILVGPGFGLRSSTGEFIKKILVGGNNLPPLIIDADGLKLLAKIEHWPSLIPSPAVLTPHPGEMSVLTGMPVEEIQGDRVTIAERYSKRWGHVVVLKGAFTVVASPDGETGILPLATPALARAGTGDVLAGVITGLVAQGIEPFHAACAGVWLHGQAGLFATEKVGSTAGVLAGDLIDEIPKLMPW